MNVDSALYFRPSYLPRLVPWLTRFWTYCNARDHERGWAALARLSERVFTLVDEMAADGVEFELYKTGMICATADAKEAQEVLDGMEPMRAFGFRLPDALLTGQELHALEPALIKEIEAVAKASEANERLLILDATVGQQAGPQAKAFHDAVAITGVIVTKLDGTAKGGGALSAVAEVKAPIVFIGVGEKVDDLERFEPPRFISRLLGMGDLESLLEKAQDAIDAQKAEELTKKILAGKFTLHEMYDQIEMLTDMGPMKKLASMIPGVVGKVKDEEMEGTQARLRRFRIIMDSMTDEEMTDPKAVKSSRVQRIARGAGVAPKDVKELLRHYDMARKAIKGFAGNRKMRKQLMKQLEAAGIDTGEE